MANTMVAILATGALLIGALSAFGIADFMGSQYSDPHETSYTYDVSGTHSSLPVTGTAESKPVHENGSFYNYRFTIDLSNEKSLDFIIIFDSSEVPFGYTLLKEEGGLREYSSDDGKITMTVSENCKVCTFTYADGDCSLTAVVR